MKNVTIYTTQTCHFCHAAKEFFNLNNIKFTEKDVSNNQEFQKEAISKSGQMGVPVIDIDGEIIVGFDKPKLSKALMIA